MTAQIPEELIYQGQHYSMCTEPLHQYFIMTSTKPDFKPECSALWRGYIGIWEIKDDRLYLKKLTGKLKKRHHRQHCHFFSRFSRSRIRSLVFR